MKAAIKKSADRILMAENVDVRRVYGTACHNIIMLQLVRVPAKTVCIGRSAAQRARKGVGYCRLVYVG